MDLIPADMTDAAMWAVIVGFVSPLVLNFIVKATWSDAIKSLVAFAFSAVVGTVTAFITGAYTGLGIPSMILLTAVVSIASYKGFWKNVTPQRGQDEAAAIENQAKVNEISAVAAPVAQAQAQKVIEALPVAEMEMAEAPSGPAIVGIDND